MSSIIVFSGRSSSADAEHCAVEREARRDIWATVGKRRDGPAWVTDTSAKELRRHELNKAMGDRQCLYE